METVGKPVALILKEEFLRRKSKNDSYSLRAFSKAIGLSSSFVSKVLSGQKNLSEKNLILIASRLKLEGKALEDLSAHWIKDKDVQFEEVNLDHFQLISDWYHYALLELITLIDFKSDKKWIADKLNITEDRVEVAIDRLHRLGLIAIDKKGQIKSLDKNLTTAQQSVPGSAHTEHERQLLRKALEALDEVQISERSQTSMTMAIPAARLDEARAKIKKFRREMNSLLQREGDRDSVYHLSISFFPLTVRKNTNQKKEEN